uniref:Nucleophosmin n=1 Tax=Junco hyemalis TaxID=40217 RepID=A0A8C5IED9_JUNHY
MEDSAMDMESMGPLRPQTFLFGCELKADKEFQFKVDDEENEHQLSLRTVTLGAGAKDELHIVEAEALDYEGNPTKVVLASLKMSVQPTVSLGGFEITPPVVLRLKCGSGPVYVSGQHLVALEEEPESDEEEDDAKIVNASAKRPASGGAKPPQKKLKLAEDDEDDDEDEDDDDDLLGRLQGKICRKQSRMEKTLSHPHQHLNQKVLPFLSWSPNLPTTLRIASGRRTRRSFKLSGSGDRLCKKRKQFKQFIKICSLTSVTIIWLFFLQILKELSLLCLINVIQITLPRMCCPKCLFSF